MLMKHVVITGAASGIGKCLAEQFAKKSAHVYAVDLNKAKLLELQTWADQNDYAIEAIVADVTSTTEIQKFIEKLESKKVRIDTWINGAAISGLGEFQELTPEQFDRVMDVNLHSVVKSTRLALKHMQKNGFGWIINMASVAGFVPAPMMSAYNLTKHAIVGFTRSLQLEMKMTGSPVKMMLVSPGFVETEIINKGQEMGFPEWLSPILAKPEVVANDIIEALQSGKQEITPTLNGKVMMGINRFFPKLLGKNSRLLMTKNWKDLLLNRY